MPFELHILKEKLKTLNILYEDAILNNAPKDEKQNIQEQMTAVKRLIIDRNETIKREQSPN